MATADEGGLRPPAQEAHQPTTDHSGTAAEHPRPAALPELDPAARQAIGATTRALAEQLGETHHQARVEIWRIVRWLGADRAWSLLEAARHIESSGGMLVEDHSRRRSFGGVFFALAKDAATPRERLLIWPHLRMRRQGLPLPSPPVTEVAPDHATKQQVPVQAQPHSVAATAGATQCVNRTTKDTRVQVYRDAEADLELIARDMMAQIGTMGRASTVKVTLIGRPGDIIEREGYVAIAMQPIKAPALPKGLPSPPDPPTGPYVALVAIKQWRKVAEALADPEDVLIIEGFGVVSAQVAGTIEVYATATTTKKLQQALRANHQRG